MLADMIRLFPFDAAFLEEQTKFGSKDAPEFSGDDCMQG